MTKEKVWQKILVLLTILSSIVFVFSTVILINNIDRMRNNSTPVEIERPQAEQAIIDELPDSIYDLRRQATDYQIEIFTELFSAHDLFMLDSGLEENLKSYAESIARNFVADFFTLSNKNSRSDVGGLQFVSEDVVDDFHQAASDTFYLYLNHHLYNIENNDLPTVVATNIVNTELGYHQLELETWPWSEYIDIVTVDIEWTYAETTMLEIVEFQNSARITFVINEDTVRIYMIKEMPELG